MALAEVNTRRFNPDVNSWEVNPHLKVTHPFNKLYALDDGGDTSSKYLWMVILACEPDEGDNPYFSLPEEQRNAMLKETWFKEFDFENPLYLECKDAYTEYCLTVAQQNLLEIKSRLKKRTKFMNDHDYSLDKTGVDQGKIYTIPGTAKQLDAMDKNTLAIHKQLREAEDLWQDSKDNGTVFGGRGETPSEKGLL